MPAPVILWYRQDLRLSDHPALTTAIKTGRPVLPLYILDEESPGQWKPGGASRWWLHHSLQALHSSLEKKGTGLLLRSGNPVDILKALLKETGASGIFATALWEPWARRRDAALKKIIGDDFKLFPGATLFGPDDIRTGAGTPYKVFTPFWRACRESGHPEKALPAPDHLPAPKSRPHSDVLADWALLPRNPDWSGGIRDRWQAGERAAQARLEAFLDDRVADYAEGRDRPSAAGTSSLSPHLHFGEISPRQIWQAVEAKVHERGDSAGMRLFLSEIGWREFCYHTLFHAPQLPERPLRSEFENFPWAGDNAGHLERWQKGMTGYPIVDAGMRELWRTGAMHNRVRMIAASFLIKDLLIPWQKGEAWFWETLVDADLANNAGNWQWVAGCGIDASPYFRIFNPVTQGEKFDPKGCYVRTWAPELTALPDKYIHAPWRAPKDILERAGIALGHTYPQPIINHQRARERALAAYKSIK